MGKNFVKVALRVDGMVCTSCESIIEEELEKIDGVASVKASFKRGSVKIEFDSVKVSLEALKEKINKLDYKVFNEVHNNSFSSKHLLGIGIVILAAYLIVQQTIGFNFIPEVTADMGYGILFVVGLMTSIHCIAMCGGINISVCTSYKGRGDIEGSKIMPSLLYNLGRVISYTIIGGFIGALGSVVTFSGGAKGTVAFIAGIFMIIMGLNMLNAFPWLRKINPRMPKFFRKMIRKNAQRGPFIVGMLNGFMPCGPLQSMQLYALGTGSFFAGAMSMFMFSIGTVPLMFGFGTASTFLSSRFTKKMMAVSAFLVMLLGVIMFNRGLNLSGVNLNFSVLETNVRQGNIARIEKGVQYVNTSLESGTYSPIVVQAGVPVKWNIQAKREDLNGCNYALTIPPYNKQVKLVPGDNLIEFTPKETGEITYTCWMGMISSTISVVSDVGSMKGDVIKKTEANSVVE